MKRARVSLVPAFLLMLLVGPSAGAISPEALLGTSPPAWSVSHWINSEPLTLDELRGRAVLVRWFMDPRCPYCSASAPALVDFHERYADRGLAVVGFYHHKGTAPLVPAEVAGHVEHYGFDFPVAIDFEWKTLRAWWLDRVESGWTSVSFLLDREGRIHHIHPGGHYIAGDSEHAALEAAIKEVLANESR